MFNELTISSTSQMLSVSNNQWDSEILNNLNLPVEKLGEVIFPGEIIGNITNAELNFSDTKLIAACSHDTASAVAAIPSDTKNLLFISTGTWCIVGAESKVPLLSKDALDLGVTNERGFNNTYRILKNIIGLWLVQGLQKSFNDEIDFGEMENLAKRATTNYLINPDDELFYNPDNMLDAFNDFFNKTSQLRPSNFGEYIKCAYDSLCYSFKFYIEKLSGLLNYKPDVLHLIGGGCQSGFLSQNVANITGLKVLSGPVEGAAIGSILVQAIAMGKIENIKEGRRMIKKSFDIKEYVPLEINDLEANYKRFLDIKK